MKLMRRTQVTYLNEAPGYVIFYQLEASVSVAVANGHGDATMEGSK